MLSSVKIGVTVPKVSQVAIKDKIKMDEILTKDIQGITYYTREETKTPVIYYRFHLNGKRYKYSSKTIDLREASRIATNRYNDIASGRVLKIITFKEALKSFIQRKKFEDKTLLTIEDYERDGKYCMEFFDKGTLPITQIDSNKLLALREWRRTYYQHHPRKAKQRSYSRKGKIVKGGKRYKKDISNRTINKTTNMAVMVVRYAWKHMKSGIAESDLPKHEPLEENIRTTFITEEELTKLTRYYFDKENNLYAYIVAFVFFTGARYPSEVNRLEWRDINLDEGIMTFRNRKSKRKSKSLDTAIPILDQVENILQRLKRDLGREPLKYEKVFVNDKEKQIKNIRISFKNAVVKCDLDPDLTMYSLRHSAITNWILNYDIPIKMISEIAGHADTVMVDRIYTKIKKSENAKAFIRKVKRVDSLNPKRRYAIPSVEAERLEEIMTGDEY